MADEQDRFSTSSQESIATAVALCDDDNSKLIANLVEVELFDAPYNDIVARCVEYRKDYGRPPGKGHIDDLFAHVLENRQHKSYNQYHTTILKMVQQADRLNTDYLLDTTSDFMRLRKMRAGMVRAIERYQQGGERVMEDLEEIFRQQLRIRDQRRDYGFSLADPEALGFLERDAMDYCNIGIRQLDERGVVPTKKELLAFLSPPNRGKSSFLVHCGKYALLKGWKIVHYTLENSEQMTAQRYFQTLFNGVRHEGTYRYARFDKEGETVTLRTEMLTPDFIIENSQKTLAFLSDKIKKSFRHRFENLRIRRFPSGKLSFEMMEQDLDELAITYGFEPDLLIVDMPSLMRLPRREKDYSALDEVITNIRGLAVERNLAAVVPQQGNRRSNSATNVQAQHGAGSFGIFGIADNLITYSQTTSEEEHGLARLYTQKVRNDRARMTICISQHYESGQFCMDSYPMTSHLRDQIKTYVGYQDGEGGDEDDEFDEPRRRRQR